MIEQSMYLVKPDAMAYRDEIREMVLESGLQIPQFSRIPIPASVLALLYPGVPSEVMAATIQHYSMGVCEVGIVDGPNAIQRLLALVGEETNPARCAPGTIRARFCHKGPIQIGKWSYCFNGVHRPKDQREARRDVKIAQGLLSGSH